MKEYVYFLIGAYLVGSLPFGLWLVLLLKKQDIRKLGSGNIGATNVWRVFGPGIGAPTFALDIAKGLAPVLAVRECFHAHGSHFGELIVATGLAAIIGHNNSIFLKFKGGKGVATSMGVALGMSWPAAAIAFVVWAIVLAVTRYISVASMIAVPIGSVGIWLFNGKAWPFAVFGILATVFSFVKHRSNIQRLKAGTEPKWGEKKTEAEENAQ
jgi:glycerol-3-phosphate acyltransferase PlsY